MRNSIKACFDHILEDHKTKGHATLIGAAIGEIYQMELEISRDRKEIADAHNLLSKAGVTTQGDLSCRIGVLVETIKSLEETVLRVSGLDHE